MKTLKICLLKETFEDVKFPNYKIIVGRENLPTEIKERFEIDTPVEFAVTIKFIPPLDFSTLHGPRKVEALATISGDAAGHIWFWKSERGWFEDCEQEITDMRWLKLLWGLAGDAFKKFGVYDHKRNNAN